MKAVVLDGYSLNPGDLSWKALEDICETVIYDRTCYDTANLELITQRIGDAEIVYTNKTPLPQAVINAAPKLKFIGVLATGYNVVDIAAAQKRKITVTNIPTYGTDSVAQMAIALLLEMCHHIGEHNRSVQTGEWEHNVDWCFWNYPLIELAGKTIGIIGFGRIGQTVGRIAQSLGMKVLAFDKYKMLELESDTLKYAALDEIFAAADVISLHCPLFKETEGMINTININKMKHGVMIINNSRGGLIVEQDLAQALEIGQVAGVALDVVSTEPIRHDNPLLGAKNCIITPHISWAPKESRQRLLDIAIDNLRHFIDEKPINVVS
jgi:glycerate dehydrogenase